VSVSFAGIIRFRFDGSAPASQPYGTPTESPSRITAAPAQDKKPDRRDFYRQFYIMRQTTL